MLKVNAVLSFGLLFIVACATGQKEQFEVDLLQCEDLQTPELRQDCRSELNAAFDAKMQSRNRLGAAFTGALAGAAIASLSDRSDTETAVLAATGALLFWQFADEIFTESTVERLEADLAFQDKQLIAQSEELGAIANEIASLSSESSVDMDELANKIDAMSEDMRAASSTARENQEVLDALDTRLDKVAAILDKSVSATEFLTTTFKVPEEDNDRLAAFISRENGNGSGVDEARNKVVIDQVNGQLAKFEERENLYQEVQNSVVSLRAQMNNLQIQLSCSEITC